MSTQEDAYEVLDYVVSETPEALVAEGILMRSKVYDYPEQRLRLLKPTEEIAKIPKLVKWVPLTLRHTSSPDVPFEERDLIIGGFTPLRAEDGKLLGRFEFDKERTPAKVLRLVKEKKPIPVSGGFSAIVEKKKGPDYDGIQREIFLKHAAIVLEGTPRCKPEEGCAVGVTDGSDSSTKQFQKELKNVEEQDQSGDLMTEAQATVDAEALKKELEATKAVVEEALDSLRTDIIDTVNDILSEDEVKKLDIEKISDAKALSVLKRILTALTPKLKQKPAAAAVLPAGEAPKGESIEDKVKQLYDGYVQRSKKRWKYAKESEE